MKISVYAGEGAQPLSLGRPLSAADIANTSWETGCSLFIMPGGRDRPYHAALQGDGCRSIRKFVENGGVYLGICAGAYFGSERIEFDKGSALEILEKRELMFFRGTAVGPAYGKGSFDYKSRKGARAAKIKTSLDSFHVYYNGGCTFEGDFSNVRILARYGDLAGAPPAIIETQVGKGKAILSGVHLETSADSLDLSDPYLAEIFPILASSEPMRRQFWHTLSHRA